LDQRIVEGRGKADGNLIVATNIAGKTQDEAFSLKTVTEAVGFLIIVKVLDLILRLSHAAVDEVEGAVWMVRRLQDYFPIDILLLCVKEQESIIASNLFIFLGVQDLFLSQ